MTPSSRSVSLLFLASGSLGLVYQVLWTRSLTLVLGNSTSAVGLVVAVFMGGLALGSWWGGRRAEGLGAASALRTYGALEAGLGLWAALTPWMFSGMHRGLLALAGPEGVPLAWKAGLVVPVLLPPTIAMGATLPLICRAAASFRNLAASFPLLYGLNTLGATGGAFLAGFIALPLLGLQRTLLAAAAGNLLVGALGALLARRWPEAPPPEEVPDGPGAEDREATPVPRGILLAAAALSGMASMDYEVAFTRALALVLGSSVYSFSLVLTLFLAGIGLGSLGALRLRSRVSPGRAFSACQAAMALAVSGLLLYFPVLPRLFMELFPRVRDSFPRILAGDFLLAAPALLAPALLMGLSLPLLVDAGAAGTPHRYRRLGDLYAANTVGGILASAAAGLWLLPWLGVEGSLRLGVALNLVASAAVLAGLAGPGRPALAAGLVGVLAVSLAVPSWSEQVMASGPAVYAPILQKAGMASPEAPGEVLFYRDGANSTVSVHRAGETLYLRVNGKTDASNGRSDMATQSMLGHLPMLAHPRPRRALVVGLGSGVTGGVCTLYPELERLDVAEIEPAMVPAAGYFRPWNRDVLASPRVRLRLNDGRNVLLEQAPYDVLSVEPSNPWIAGIASLFTREFYQICRERLAPGGVLCQWIHLNALEEPELRMVVATFADVFPRGQVWLGASKDLLLLAWRDPDPTTAMPGRLQEAWERLPAVQRDLQDLGVATPLAFYGRYVGELEDLRPWCEGARRNTDDLPLLEYLAPLNLYRAGKAEETRKVLMRYRKGAFPPSSGLVGREAELAPALAGTARANQDPELEAWFLERGRP